MSHLHFSRIALKLTCTITSQRRIILKPKSKRYLPKTSMNSVFKDTTQKTCSCKEYGGKRREDDKKTVHKCQSSKQVTSLLYLNYLFQQSVITRTCTSHVRPRKFALAQRPKRAGQFVKAPVYVHEHLSR